jgi:hypothetical protein
MLMEAHVLMFWQMSGSDLVASTINLRRVNANRGREAKLVDLITAIGLQLPCR